MKKEYAEIERIIVEFDNGHETVLYNDEYKLKIKHHKIKIKRIKKKEIEKK